MDLVDRLVWLFDGRGGFGPLGLALNQIGYGCVLDGEAMRDSRAFLDP